MTQVIMQAAIETTKAAVWGMSETADPTKRNNAAGVTQSMNVKSSRPALKQSIFSWKVQEK